MSASGVPPYVLFRTALDSGNLAWVRTLAAQMPHIGLADALGICLMMRDGDPGVLDRAAVRWLGRFALEARGATIADIRRAAELLDFLQSEPEAAMEQLAQLCVRFDLIR